MEQTTHQLIVHGSPCVVGVITKITRSTLDTEAEEFVSVKDGMIFLDS